ncbi:18S rRNA (guanine1575-N7)-methyltransferase [Nematocida minor]|uniref:18S rRNA (guanine1575-N7)-methyltransferase n=1 Tax=Nematocida minor TaxID=1912983 RepID=UPI00221E4D0B|nr:18S rRNA (guanine1575-N7)-methyltransferase [Nematocida minor]KAI5192152.1 18S rRNA (guanine1575-N7)-methyltransferase [Nematocida minor]
MGRPESLGAKVYYTGETAEKYDSSSSLNNIQSRLTERCLDILGNPKDSFVLDIGCGSGISTEHILDNNNYVVGIDISMKMLDLAKERIGSLTYNEVPANKYCDFAAVDIGAGLPFKSATFDYAVSVSVLQWLAVQKESKKLLNAFFYTLYDVLKTKGMAVLQYYPESDKQMEAIVKCASKYGFTGGTLVENQDSKKKRKTYLILEMPGAKGESNHVPATREKSKYKKVTANKDLELRDWIIRKKQKRMERGFDVPRTSKFTGRKRS